MAATRKLSTKWFNVLRRKVRATKAAEDKSVRCPDCDDTMRLMEGRWGRFYRCDRWECKGTIGARLDGTPRPERGTPEELEARRRVRAAVRQYVDLQEEIAQLRKKPQWSAFGFDSRCVLPLNAFEDIAREAGVGVANERNWRGPLGLHLRRRNVEDCRRIEVVVLRYIEAAIIEMRRVRNTAWDRVLLAED